MTEKESAEDKLVAASRAGDRDNFGELVERHFGRVFRTTRRITRHREDAEDVVQGE
jgi:DNA-directed RNA polymerase specialized sigma24 family protein